MSFSDAILFISALLTLSSGCGGSQVRSEPGVRDQPEPETRAVPTVDDGMVEINGRKIDLKAHLTAYPFSRWPSVDLRSGRYFVTKRAEGGREDLMMAHFAPVTPEPVALDDARRISPRDFTTRNLWGIAWSPQTATAIIMADENNDETLNLYELDPDTGQETRLTDVAYIYDFELSPDGRLVACTTRSQREETSRGHVHIVDLVARTSKVVFTDSTARKMVWGAISWQPNGEGLLVPFMRDSLRKKRNLMYVPLRGGEPRVLTDHEKTRTTISSLEWADDDHYLYQADDEGGIGVYRGSLKSGRQVRVTPSSENVKSAGVVHDTDSAYVVAITGNPLTSTIQLIDATTTKVKWSEDYPGSMFVYDTHDDLVAVKTVSMTNPFSMSVMRLSGGEVTRAPLAKYPSEVLDEVVHCNVEKVSFPTFDEPEVPGEEKGDLHGYVLSPKRPLPEGEARALVLSFYGGSNYFSTDFQVLCAAGYHVMSPAPRGTSDFGSTFLSLGDGDWGGGETLDAFYAGQFLSEHLDLPADHIGIFGGSRGGYDTMRALTFPGEVNGVSVDFRFGFGISSYGISDILRAYEDGNIQGWYVKLTGGDPSLDLEKWRDRSPITHVDNLKVPLLLTHGDKDSRVPVEESRRFFEAAKARGKDVTYLELEGQGHGYKGVAAQTQYFRAVLEFLEGLGDAREPAR